MFNSNANMLPEKKFESVSLKVWLRFHTMPAIRKNSTTSLYPVGLYLFVANLRRDFLPRGSGIVTRRPLILQLINGPTGQDISQQWDRPSCTMFS